MCYNCYGTACLQSHGRCKLVIGWVSSGGGTSQLTVTVIVLK